MIDILLDSGAYTAYTQGTNIDIDEYIEFIKKYNQYLSGYISLDVIGSTNSAKDSYKNWEYIRSKGLNPIPVYHMREDPKYLQQYVEQTDYIAIGGVASRKTAKALTAEFDLLWSDHLLNEDSMPRVKVHAMGITDVPTMIRYPWFSIDSSTWLIGRKTGLLLTPYMTKTKKIYTKTPIRIDISPRSPYRTVRGAHFDRMDKKELSYEKVYSHIESMGIPFGEAQTDDNGNPILNKEGKEIVIKDGLCTQYTLRDAFNQLYFMELEKVLLDWPWQWFVDSRQMYFREMGQITPSSLFPTARTRVYLAGGGVDEATNYKVAHQRNFPYRRMLSYIDLKPRGEDEESKAMSRVINLIKGEQNESKSNRIRKRIVKNKRGNITG